MMTYEEIQEMFVSPTLDHKTIAKLLAVFTEDNRLVKSLFNNPSISKDAFIQFSDHFSFNKFELDNLSLDLWLVEDPAFLEKVSSNVILSLLTNDYDKWAPLCKGALFRNNFKTYRISEAFARCVQSTEEDLIFVIGHSQDQYTAFGSILDSKKMSASILEAMVKYCKLDQSSYIWSRMIDSEFVTKEMLLTICNKANPDSSTANDAKIKYFDLFVNPNLPEE